MTDLVDQIDALLALNAKGAVSHPIPGLAVELLERAQEALSRRSLDGVKVKELVWNASGEAKGAFAKYTVYDGFKGTWNAVCYPHEGSHYRIAEGVGSEDAAKSAAYEHHSAAILSSLTPSPTPAVDEVTFQSRVAEAHAALFHDDPTDLAERRDRFYEEATEAVQSLNMTEEDAHKLVSYTFNRPIGDVQKEIGAAALTLASLCVIGGWDMMACAEADLAALQTPEKIAKVRAKRATRHGRGPLPGLAALNQKQPGGK